MQAQAMQAQARQLLARRARRARQARQARQASERGGIRGQREGNPSLISREDHGGKKKIFPLFLFSITYLFTMYYNLSFL